MQRFLSYLYYSIRRSTWLVVVCVCPWSSRFLATCGADAKMKKVRCCALLGIHNIRKDMKSLRNSRKGNSKISYIFESLVTSTRSRFFRGEYWIRTWFEIKFILLRWVFAFVFSSDLKAKSQHSQTWHFGDSDLIHVLIV